MWRTAHFLVITSGSMIEPDCPAIDNATAAFFKRISESKSAVATSVLPESVWKRFLEIYEITEDLRDNSYSLHDFGADIPEIIPLSSQFDKEVQRYVDAIRVSNPGYRDGSGSLLDKAFIARIERTVEGAGRLFWRGRRGRSEDPL